MPSSYLGSSSHLSSPVMSPIDSPELVKQASIQNLVELLAHHSQKPTASRSSSMNSIQWSDDPVDVVTEEGLMHCGIKLEAKRYKTEPFKATLLEVLKALNVPSWGNAQDLSPNSVTIFKVSGSLTNAVFFVSCPENPSIRTVLLRIYGPSSGELISRPRELHTLHILSSQYRIGPRVFGTFENGRIEEYFDSTTLTVNDIRDKTISRWIGARMAELHSVDIEAVENTSPETRGEGKGWESGAKKNVKAWVHPAREVLALPAVSEEDRKTLQLDLFMARWTRYIAWVKEQEDTLGASPRVFAHNDAQYGNLLRTKTLKEGQPEHRQIIVVDFEYASPNPAAYDIANHFVEWCADYHSATPHLLRDDQYPTTEQRFNFYDAYLEQTLPHATPEIRQKEAQALDKMVEVWTPATHAMWAMWGIVQAKEDLEGRITDPEFDYIGFAKGKMAMFYRLIDGLRLEGKA